jgi:uncharacterized repeat protein (TIGR03806 family)
VRAMPGRPQVALLFVASCLLPVLGCGGGGGGSGDGGGGGPAGPSGPVQVDLDAPPPAQLSAYNLFTWDPAAGFAFNERVVPYDVNTALFSDYALKQRAIYVPDGAAASFDPERPLDLPVGAVVLKTFYYPADLRAPSEHLRLIETRLLVRHADGWHPLPYIWDAAQQDAVLTPAGEVRAISFVDGAGATQVANYLVPQRNECQSCHAEQDTPDSPIELVLIGVKARHLNRAYDYGGTVGSKNQLDRLTELGMLTGAPAAASIPAAYDFRPIEASGPGAIAPGELDTVARSYLDINCAHCHNPHGVQGMTSQLFLNHDNLDPFHLGVCKRPGSAGTGNGGFTFDIVPGDPDTSILYFRTDTTKVGAMMPLLGRSLTHGRGAELIHAWLAAMPANDCGTTP